MFTMLVEVKVFDYKFLHIYHNILGVVKSSFFDNVKKLLISSIEEIFGLFNNFRTLNLH